MSSNNPIPTRDRAEFFEHMKKAEDGDEWLLLDTAEEFMIKKKYGRGDPHSAVQQYLKHKAATS